MTDKVEFNAEQVQQYLDDNIRHWRKKNKEGRREAQYYIDAYQSVRMSLFGELLPPEGKIAYTRGGNLIPKEEKDV